MRIERFLKSQFYVSRKATHIGQSIPNDANNLCFKFLKEIIDKRKFNNYALSDIINLDETPIFLDSPSLLTLTKKGDKNVTLKTYGKENIRITCLLTIKGDGSKLMHLYLKENIIVIFVINYKIYKFLKIN